MATPNVQDVEQGRLVVVQLGGDATAFITITPPARAGHQPRIDLKPLMNGGLDEHQALKYVHDIMMETLRCTTLEPL